MKRTTLATVFCLVSTAPVWAQTGYDANGDGEVTMEEMAAVYPDVTAEMFSQIDTDASGTLSADELAAGIEAGLVPAAE